MANLKIDVSNFKGTYNPLNLRKQIAVTEEQALHAAITVGTPLLRKGTHSQRHALAMATYKAVAVKATMDFSQTNLSGFSAYRQLDPSEKTNLSYWIGMVFTALLAKELVKVEQLLHAACFKQRRIGKTNPASKSLADLVGRDANKDWHVLEAKGRQNKPTAQNKTAWKMQCQTINRIGGKTPKTHSFCIAMVGSIYRAELEDPDGKTGSIEIEFGRAGEDQDLLEAYYGPLRDVLKQSSFDISRGNLNFVLARIAYDAVTNRHVFVGMEQSAFVSIVNNQIPHNIRPLTGPDFYFGSDGIVTLTSDQCVPVSD